MKRIYFSCLLIAAVAACSPTPITGGEDEGSWSLDGLTEIPEAKPITIGDIETSLEVLLELNAQSKGENVDVEDRLTKMKKVTMTTLTVNPPHPEKLWLSLGMMSINNFPEHAVLVKYKVFVDDVLVDEDSFMFKKLAMSDPQIRKIEVLSARDSTPETMLARAEVQVTFFEFTDPATIDPDTAETPKEITATVYSNTVRINFPRE